MPTQAEVNQSIGNVPAPSSTAFFTRPPDKNEEKDKNLYNVPYKTIVWRNFAAGASRTIGGLFIYLIFLGITGFIAAQFLAPFLPSVLTVFETYSQGLPTSPTPSNRIIP